MKIVFLIGLGSFLGGILRYWLSGYVQAKFYSEFPLGTFAVNLTGCFFIGLAFGFAERGSLSQETRIFLTTGILGGFTTFSAFSNETLGLLRQGTYGLAAAYALGSLILGILATFLGYVLAKSRTTSLF